MTWNKRKFLLKNNFGQCTLNKKLILTQGIILLLAAFSACTEYPEPGLLYSPIQSKVAAPAIEGVTPAQKALGGVREITIVGKNFVVPGTETVWVHIGGVRAKIKSLQDNSITVYRPLLASDRYDTKIHISITRPEALDTSATRAYEVEAPVTTFGDYSGVTTALVAADIDKNGNLCLIPATGNIYKTDPTGNAVLSLVSSLTGGTSITSGPRDTVPAIAGIRDVKFGPALPIDIEGSSLYVATSDSSIFRIRILDEPYEMGDRMPIHLRPVRVAKFPMRVLKMDFGSNGDIYACGAAGIYKFTKSDSSYSSASLGDAGVNVTDLRVFKDSIYVSDSTRVWKRQIIGNGASLSAPTTIVNLADIPELSSCRISSFTLDEYGNVYLCLLRHSRYSIFIVESSASVVQFYYEDILPRNIGKLVWGTGRYLYLIYTSGGTTANKVFKMAFDRNGAIYNGR